jgi:hypothetical protein
MRDEWRGVNPDWYAVEPMSLLPDEACFEELVQDCFLAFRGAGVMLSPLDAELLSEWAALHVPYEVVARGIRKAAERALWDARPDEPGLRSLRACRREVKAEIKKYLDRAAGGTQDAEPTLESDRNKKLRSALRKFAKEQPRFEPVIHRLLDRLSHEDQVMGALARALSFDERVRLTRQVRQRVAEAKPLSAAGRRMSRRFHRGALLRQMIDLPGFW